MSKYLAQYLVQRGDQQFICRGDKLYSRLKAGDLVAVYRDGTLYHSTVNRLRDSDWLVCMDGSVTKKISGSNFIPLLLKPPTLTPLTVKVDGEVYVTNSIIEVSPRQEVDLEVIVNSAAQNLSIKYEWLIRSGNGQFISSNNARVVAYQCGVSGPENINCHISAIGADPSQASTDVIQLFVNG